MKRGDEQPMKPVMPVIRSSFSNACCTESAISSVSARPLPSGKNISTANWSRSAYGKRRIFSVGAMSVDNRMTPMPPPIVIQGCWKVQSNTLLYTFCTQCVMALPPVLTLPGLMMCTSRNGMTVTARMSDTIRLMVIVMGKSSKQSWNTPFMVRRNGKKMAQIQMVASIIGMKYCLADSMAATFGS